MSGKVFTPVARVDEVGASKSKVIDVNGTSILLCHSIDRVFAVINRCSHAQEKLDCGRIRAGWIACPVHGARFDLETGEAMNPPATLPIQTFAVRIVGDMIEVEV
ncbi:MAG: hypothetical protein RL367_2558 [Pseudomonadota bacterium]